MSKESLVNKIAESGLVTLDFEKILKATEWEYLDIKQFLVKEMMLMEKPYRESLKSFDWNKYSNKWVAVYCSSEALIPHWAYMLISSYLKNVNSRVFFATGNEREDEKLLLKELVNNLEPEKYQNQKVIVKGCGNLKPGASFYLSISEKLIPHVKSLMYGEPCSTVPVYKKKS